MECDDPTSELSLAESCNEVAFTIVFSNSSFDDVEANVVIIFLLLDKNEDYSLRDDDILVLFLNYALASLVSC